MRLEFQSEDIWRIEAIIEAPTNVKFTYLLWLFMFMIVYIIFALENVCIFSYFFAFLMIDK